MKNEFLFFKIKNDILQMAFKNESCNSWAHIFSNYVKKFINLFFKKGLTNHSFYDIIIPESNKRKREELKCITLRQKAMIAVGSPALSMFVVTFPSVAAMF